MPDRIRDSGDSPTTRPPSGAATRPASVLASGAILPAAAVHGSGDLDPLHRLLHALLGPNHVWIMAAGLVLGALAAVVAFWLRKRRR